MLFVQTAAPTGWTKNTSHHDRVLRIVNTDGGGIGGVLGFSTVFSRTTADYHAIDINEMPQHSHLVNCFQGTGNFNGAGYLATQAFGVPDGTGYIMQGSTSFTNPYPIADAGGGGGHTHGMDIRVAYTDAIICTKN
jgi:hypothetical protein